MGKKDLWKWWKFLAQLRLPDGTGRGPGRSSLGFQDLLALAILMEAMII